MLHVAVAGFGWWGQYIATRLRGNARFRIACVVEPARERHDQVRALGFDVVDRLDDVLCRSDIQAVILATPNLEHERQAVACAGAGKHVFCEKPLGLTGASARRTVAACVAAGVQLGIGHERRFEPALRALMDMVSRGDLGTIMHAEAAFSHDKLKDVAKGNWRASRTVAPAAGMTAMGIHLTDLYIAMFGRVRTVQAMTADRVLGWPTGDVVTAQLGFESGVTATLSAVSCTPLFIRLHVFGSEQWVEIRNGTHPDTPGGVAHMEIAGAAALHQTRLFDWTDCVTANLEAFADAIEGTAPYPHTTEQMVHNIEVLEAIASSAESRQTVLIE